MGINADVLKRWYLALDGVNGKEPASSKVREVANDVFEAYLDQLRDEIRSDARDTDRAPEPQFALGCDPAFPGLERTVLAELDPVTGTVRRMVDLGRNPGFAERPTMLPPALDVPDGDDDAGYEIVIPLHDEPGE